MPVFSKTLGNLDYNDPASIKAVANHIRAMQDELEYRLAHLDSANINEINMDETQVFSSKGGLLQLLNESAESVAKLSVRDDEISQSVEDVERNVSSAISQTAEGLTAEIRGVDGKYTTLKATVDGVTIRGEDGTTKIKGNSIETDTLYVNAANIRGTLTADQIVLSGAITWNSLDSSTQTKITNAETNASGAVNAASAAYSTAYQVANGTYQGGSFISGRNIYSPNLYGDTITLLDGSSNRVGAMSLRQGNTNAFDLTSDVSLRLRSAAGYNAYISSGNGPFLLLDGQNQMCYLGGAPLVLDENTFGSSLPSGAIHGQVYFLLS